MTKLLVDTHVWLWSLSEPARLSSEARTSLMAPDAQLWLSPISVWETLLLAERGRIEVDGPPADWIRRALTRAPYAEASLTHAVATASGRTGLEHPDPADRLLVATAIVYDLTFVTADRRILDFAECDVLAA